MNPIQWTGKNMVEMLNRGAYFDQVDTEPMTIQYKGQGVNIGAWLTDTLVLQEGTVYTTRYGAMARIVSTSEAGDYPILAEVTHSDGTRYLCLQADGTCHDCSVFDIVGLWKG